MTQLRGVATVAAFVLVLCDKKERRKNQQKRSRVRGAAVDF